MNALSSVSAVFVTVFAVAAAPTWAQQQHEGDVIVGHSAADQLKVEADIGLSLLDPVNNLFLKGWAATEPGLESLLADEPFNDFYMLAPGAQISLVGISLDPVFKVHSPMLDYLIASPSDQLPLGGNELHEHPIWHIDSHDPGFNPLQTVWSGTFRLIDTGTTGYAASDLFSLSFTNVPEPATLGLLAVGALAAMRRRRDASKALVATALLTSVWTCEPAQAQHLGDLWVAHSSAATGNQLKIASASGGYNPFDPIKNLAVLAPINGPYFYGWSGTSPGFDAFRTDLPATDTYALAPGAEIWLDILAIDSPFTIIVPPDYYFYDSPGPCTDLGDYQLHIHPIWLIDTTSPSFNPTQCTWRVTFRLRDAGSTGYAPSAPFTLRFATSNVSPTDFDCDSDVDLTDFGLVQSCFNGPNRPAAGPNCEDADMDFDGDVDLADFGVFQACFNGPNRPPACQ